MKWRGLFGGAPKASTRSGGYNNRYEYSNKSAKGGYLYGSSATLGTSTRHYGGGATDRYTTPAQPTPQRDPDPEPELDEEEYDAFDEPSGAPSLNQTIPRIRRSDAIPETYDIGQQLGEGAFAVVFVGKNRTTGKDVAIKKIDRSKMQWGDRDALADEIDNMAKVHEGPHIVQLYEVYEERDDCYLVLELMQGGELFDRIIEKGSLNEKEARDVMRCLLGALAYMHARKVVHRDLKPENLLIADTDSNVKIADFGFSKTVKTRNSCRTLCGTPGYLAPEILERWPAYDCPCDMWSVGVIMFLLLGGYLPFDDDDEDEVFEQTRNGDYDFHEDYWGKVSKSSKNLVTQLLTVNPTKRATAEDSLKHAWMEREEKSLKVRPLNVNRIKQSIVVGRERNAKKEAKNKFKMAVKTVIASGRVNDRMTKLQDGVNHYRETHQSRMEFKKQSVVPKSRPVREEESSSGNPFSSFYELDDMPNEEGFATLTRAKHKKTGQSVAVKKVDRTQLEGRDLMTLKDEIASLKILRGGPHIIRLIDVFEEPTYTFLVTEEMLGGEMLQGIVDKKVYTEREARELCKILLIAVDYCHKKKVTHRDLKPENLLLSEKGHDTSLMVTNFGFAKKVLKQNSLKTLCGTVSYVAPEVLDLKWGGYDERADMWSIGVIVYILLGGYAPFEAPVQELAAVIMRGEYEFHHEYWSHVSPGAKDLVKVLLEVNPDSRITAEEALKSEWMIVEAESLILRDLKNAQTQISKSIAKGAVAKVRGAINTIIAANMLNDIGENFTRRLGTKEKLKKRSSMIQKESSAKVEKTFSQLYETGKHLGHGNFCMVFEGTHKETQTKYAVKSIKRRDMDPTAAVAMQNEISTLQAVSGCPQIVKFIDVFDEADCSYLVVEQLQGGELIDRILDNGKYNEVDARELTKNLLLGIKYCHEKEIANRNLQPEKLLLVSQESNTDVKISDFGYAKKVLYPNSLRTHVGSEGYTAPEIIEHQPAYGVSCDIWSIGVVLYYVLGGYRPFRGSAEDVMKKIRYGEYEFHYRHWRNVSYEAKELIAKMLVVDPEERITAADALQSRWILTDDN